MQSSGKLATVMRFAIGLSLVLAQLVMIVAARYHPMRYFCWAPYDSMNEYKIVATVDGAPLEREETHRRYGLREKGLNPRSIQEIIQIVSYVEHVYHGEHPARVVVFYRTNGSEERQWCLALP